MNKEINHECKRLLQGCDEINKVERERAGRSEGNRKENQELLHLDDAGAIGDTEQPRTPAFAYATKEQVTQAMMDEPTHKFEIMYSHLLYNFEKNFEDQYQNELQTLQHLDSSYYPSPLN